MGFLSKITARVRRETGEPTVQAKYTDSVLLEYIENAWMSVLTDIAKHSRHQLAAWFDISIVAGKSTYMLPPNVSKILDLQYVTESGDVLERYGFSSLYKEVGIGLLVEGDTLRFQTAPTSSWTLRVIFRPSGCVHLHDGAAGAIVNDVSADECTIALAAAPTTGTLDTRPHAYVGSTLRILTATTNNYEQVRTIREYDVATRIATLTPAFTAAHLPGGAAVTYEIAPQLNEQLWLPISLWVSQHITALEGSVSKYKLLGFEYMRAIAPVHILETGIDGIGGIRMNPQTRANSRVMGGDSDRIDFNRW